MKKVFSPENGWLDIFFFLKLSVWFVAGDGIKADILKMGTIFDWQKEYFTMDNVSCNNKFEQNQTIIIHFMNSANLLP